MKSFPDKILVTGLGAITPLGNTMEENWHAVLERRTAISPITRFDLGGIACQKGGTIGGADAEVAGASTPDALIALAEIRPNKGQPRKNFDEEALEELDRMMRGSAE